MNERILRRCVAFASATATATALLTTAQAAGALTPGIQSPSLTVVCSRPHTDALFSAVRFTQRGQWAARETVSVTITQGTQTRPKAVIYATTSRSGSFYINRRILRPNTVWRHGARYIWTTQISSASSVTAARGSVVLRGTC